MLSRHALVLTLPFLDICELQAGAQQVPGCRAGPQQSTADAACSAAVLAHGGGSQGEEPSAHAHPVVCLPESAAVLSTLWQSVCPMSDGQPCFAVAGTCTSMYICMFHLDYKIYCRRGTSPSSLPAPAPGCCVCSATGGVLLRRVPWCHVCWRKQQTCGQQGMQRWCMEMSSNSCIRWAFGWGSGVSMVSQ
jgi:hypothetical protein